MIAFLLNLPKYLERLCVLHQNHSTQIIQLQERVSRMSKELEDLRAAVAENAAVTESAVALIDGLADRLEAALDKSNDDESDEPIHELLEDLRASSRSLADAVAANTQAGGINPQSGAEGSAGGPGDSPVASTPPDQK